MSNNKNYQDVKDDLREAVHNVKGGFGELRDGLSSAVENVVDAGKTAAASAKSRFEEGVNSAKHSASGLLQGTTKRIGQSPMTSILVAAGIGFLSGLLIARK